MTWRSLSHALVVLAPLVSGCGKRSQQGEPVAAAEQSETPRASESRTTEEALPRVQWELESSLLERPAECDRADNPGTYEQALDAGRAAGTAKRWADAVAAFEHALGMRADDSAALSELAWALLQTGDAERALAVGERAVAGGPTPNAKATAHYNAGRAAEALGRLDAARQHYERSLALREHAGVRDRLAQLAAAPVRQLERAVPLQACQGLASVDEVCACLTKGTEGGALPPSAASCEPTDTRGEHGVIVRVVASDDEDEGLTGRSALVLVARQGETWSALHILETPPSGIWHSEQRVEHEAQPLQYAERPSASGTLLWVVTKQEERAGARGVDVEGTAGLTVCDITPSGAGAWCSKRLQIADWRYRLELDQDDPDAGHACLGHQDTAYLARLTSSGALTLVLARGVDEAGRVGRYQR